MNFSSPVAPEGDFDSAQELPDILGPRLEALLEGTSAEVSTLFETPSTAQGWLELSHEATLAQDFSRALMAATSGLDLAWPGAHPEDVPVVLSLLRAEAYAHHFMGNNEQAEVTLARRAELLRSMGFPRKADVEQQLGMNLLDVPDSFTVTICEGLVEVEEPTADTAQPDVLLTLAMTHLNEGRLEEAEELVESALRWDNTVRGAEAITHPAAKISRQRFLAHVLVSREKFDQADALAEQLLSSGCSRDIRADLWLMRARIHYSSHDYAHATRFALRALEIFAAIRVRSEATAAASLIAHAAADIGAEDIALLGWKVAAAQAEQGEIPDSPFIQLALAHHYLDTGHEDSAKQVLTALRRRNEQSPGEIQVIPVIQREDEHIPFPDFLAAQISVSMGHAHRVAADYSEAVTEWFSAAKAFSEAGALTEATQLCLSTGSTLLLQHEKPYYAGELFAQAVTYARELPAGSAALLAHTLHMNARAQGAISNETAIMSIDEAIAIASSLEGAWYVANFTQTKAKILKDLDRHRQAVSTALTAADLFIEVDDPTSAQEAEVFAGNVLLDDNRAPEAQAIFSLVADAAENPDENQRAAMKGLAAAYRAQDNFNAAQRIESRLTSLENED